MLGSFGTGNTKDRQRWRMAHDYRIQDLDFARHGFLSMEANMTRAQDAELRDQIVGSCRLITRHIEGVLQDTLAISAMPSYKTSAEDLLNTTERVINLAAQAIARAKLEMGKKKLERVAS